MKDKEIHLDGIDKIIIKRLVNDARTPILTIAREVGISGAAIHQRLRKLEKSNLIEGYKLVINPKALGYTTTAFVGIFLDASNLYSSAIKRLKEIANLEVECHKQMAEYEHEYHSTKEERGIELAKIEAKLEAMNNIEPTLVDIIENKDKEIERLVTIINSLTGTKTKK